MSKLTMDLMKAGFVGGNEAEGPTEAGCEQAGLSCALGERTLRQWQSPGEIRKTFLKTDASYF